MLSLSTLAWSAKAQAPAIFINETDYYTNTLISHQVLDYTVPKVIGLSSKTLCSCVLYAERVSGLNPGVIGVAQNWPINASEPTVGSIVVLREGPVGHVAEVTAVHDTTIDIIEANYSHCAVTTRTLLKTNHDIRGYYVLPTSSRT